MVETGDIRRVAAGDGKEGFILNVTGRDELNVNVLLFADGIIEIVHHLLHGGGFGPDPFFPVFDDHILATIGGDSLVRAWSEYQNIEPRREQKD